MRKYAVLFLTIFIIVCAGNALAASDSTPQSKSDSAPQTASDSDNAVVNTGKDVAGSAGNTAVDATKSNINQGVREGVNSLFKGAFK